MVTEMACYTYSMVIVPLYDTLGPDACSYIINQGKYLTYKNVMKPSLVRISVPNFTNIITDLG